MRTVRLFSFFHIKGPLLGLYYNTDKCRPEDQQGVLLESALIIEVESIQNCYLTFDCFCPLLLQRTPRKVMINHVFGFFSSLTVLNSFLNAFLNSLLQIVYMKGLRIELMYPSQVVRRKSVIDGSRCGSFSSIMIPDQVLHRKNGNQHTRKQTAI